MHPGSAANEAQAVVESAGRNACDARILWQLRSDEGLGRCANSVRRLDAGLARLLRPGGKTGARKRKTRKHQNRQAVLEAPPAVTAFCRTHYHGRHTASAGPAKGYVRTPVKRPHTGLLPSRRRQVRAARVIYLTPQRSHKSPTGPLPRLACVLLLLPPSHSFDGQQSCRSIWIRILAYTPTH